MVSSWPIVIKRYFQQMQLTSAYQLKDDDSAWQSNTFLVRLKLGRRRLWFEVTETWLTDKIADELGIHRTIVAVAVQCAVLSEKNLLARILVCEVLLSWREFDIFETVDDGRWDLSTILYSLVWTQHIRSQKQICTQKNVTLSICWDW